MLNLNKKILILISTFTIVGCSSSDVLNTVRNSGSEFYSAATLKEKDVVEQSLKMAGEFDSQNKLAPANSQYSKRLNKIVKSIKLPSDHKFNFKVYLSEDANAFAMPDGTVRVYSGLMDIMDDGQLLAVIGHEIGHVVEKHSFKQMKKALLASGAVRAAAGQTQASAVAYNVGGGALVEKFIEAQFSQSDELAADGYAVEMLKNQNKNPKYMQESIEVLQAKYGKSGGLMSSHPSNPKRIENLEKLVN